MASSTAGRQWHVCVWVNRCTIQFFSRMRCFVHSGLAVVDGHANRIINRYVRNLVGDSSLQTACFVDELKKDSRLYFITI